MFTIQLGQRVSELNDYSIKQGIPTVENPANAFYNLLASLNAAPQKNLPKKIDFLNQFPSAAPGFSSKDGITLLTNAIDKISVNNVTLSQSGKEPEKRLTASMQTSSTHQSFSENVADRNLLANLQSPASQKLERPWQVLTPEPQSPVKYKSIEVLNKVDVTKRAELLPNLLESEPTAAKQESKEPVKNNPKSLLQGVFEKLKFLPGSPKDTGLPTSGVTRNTPQGEPHRVIINKNSFEFLSKGTTFAKVLNRNHHFVNTSFPKSSLNFTENPPTEPGKINHTTPNIPNTPTSFSTRLGLGGKQLLIGLGKKYGFDNLLSRDSSSNKNLNQDQQTVKMAAKNNTKMVDAFLPHHKASAQDKILPGSNAVIKEVSEMQPDIWKTAKTKQRDNRGSKTPSAENQIQDRPTRMESNKLNNDQNSHTIQQRNRIVQSGLKMRGETLLESSNLVSAFKAKDRDDAQINLNKGQVKEFQVNGSSRQNTESTSNVATKQAANGDPNTSTEKTNPSLKTDLSSRSEARFSEVSSGQFSSNKSAEAAMPKQAATQTLIYDQPEHFLGKLTRTIQRHVQQMRYQSYSGQQHLLIRLKPEGLGHLRIRLDMRLDQLNADIETTRPETTHLLQSHQTQLNTKLQELGIQVQDFQIFYNEDLDLNQQYNGDAQQEKKNTDSRSVSSEKQDTKNSEKRTDQGIKEGTVDVMV